MVTGDTPNRRYGTAAVYDPESHSLVNFAGFTSAGRFDDTWTFHLGDEGWHELAPGDSLGGRQYPANVYDETHDRFLVLGRDTGDGKDRWRLGAQSGR